MFEEIQEVVERGFREKTILVIGDLMLDKYLMGNVTRISPEAPVPVLKAGEEKFTLGGAGNVALNLKNLEATVCLLGLIGDDFEGKIVKKILDKHAFSTDHILSSPQKPTITKTRIVGDHQQIVRIDKEDSDFIGPDIETKFIEKIKAILAEQPIDAIIVSDYAKGIITQHLCRSIIQQAKKAHVPVLVDPKSKEFAKYKSATVLMPNEHELSAACNREFKDEDELIEAAENVYNQLGIDYLVVTRGEKGILLIADGYSHNIPTRAREVYDVSGAGDTVIALVAFGFSMGLAIEKSLELANLAAGYVVSKFGTHPISYSELKNVLHRHFSDDQKIFDEDQIESRLTYWRNNDQKIVFTNGCFDIIHAGHIHLLRKAKKEGDKLIVAINTDDSVHGLKGGGRPFNTLTDRMGVLEAISFVDAIIPFNEPTPLPLINRIMPDVLVKGADYEEDEIVGASEVKSHGGKVARVPLIEGKSTTGLINEVVNNNG